MGCSGSIQSGRGRHGRQDFRRKMSFLAAKYLLGGGPEGWYSCVTKGLMAAVAPSEREEKAALAEERDALAERLRKLG
eukprot:253299-Prorocentrum_minimum.AAC.1